MAHLLAPKPADIQLPVFFNVDGVVGAPPAQNIREDVLLVQFAFTIIAASPPPGGGMPFSPEESAAFRAVKVTGAIDTVTINAIRIFQQGFKKKYPKTVADGRVSPAQGSYSYGGTIWTIARLNESIQDRYKDVWPRIDKIPGCPGGLIEMVNRQVVGI